MDLITDTYIHTMIPYGVTSDIWMYELELLILLITSDIINYLWYLDVWIRAIDIINCYKEFVSDCLPFVSYWMLHDADMSDYTRLLLNKWELVKGGGGQLSPDGSLSARCYWLDIGKENKSFGFIYHY